jgi:hypothetical protein
MVSVVMIVRASRRCLLAVDSIPDLRDWILPVAPAASASRRSLAADGYPLLTSLG